MRWAHTVVKMEGRSAEYNYCRIPWQMLRAIGVTAKGEVRKYGIWVNHGHEAPEILLYVEYYQKVVRPTNVHSTPESRALYCKVCRLGAASRTATLTTPCTALE
jgi:hypothetical protein